jgi:8-oxo-dGTP pyrophosphatase MutT (NUDIX family)
VPERLPTRHAARVILLDPDGRVLLMRYDDGPPNGRHWSTPGGGIEEGEDYRTAALRELAEETGWDDIELGDEVLRRTLEMEYGGRIISQHERLFLARTDHPQRAIHGVEAMHASDGIAAWRWWSLAEIDGAEDPIWPPGLADLIRQVAPAA